ncbi:Neurotrypsin [Stylophora pistillata]|uniref:Neurotrypsin n=1 Tax=Stylophora pistillata TaxID=50429 RepID=A0A2B4RHJ3_STYPI|nr:Neurotrypsin [Stylophora pistillata]
MRDFKYSLLFAYLVWIIGICGHQRPNCEYRSGERELVCEEIIDPSLAQNIAESTERIVFTSDSLACDCSLRALLEWREELSLTRSVALEGTCSSPKYPLGQSINSLSPTDISCGAGDALLVRKRRAADEGQQPNENKTYIPDAPLWPCDFEQGLCQWFQLHNGDFHWTRYKGDTPSSNTGPTTDHTKGTVNGYYIYIETSLPRRRDHKARLVSPTLAPVDPSNTCQMDLFIHMKGSHIGELNIYQQPVVGFAVKKLSLTTNQGSDWFKRQVQFDSDTKFQVIIEGVRGAQYQGDIALDDISFTAGCKRLAPSYVRLVNGSTFNEGRVEVYHQELWQPVCSEGWSQSDSSVACRELGFKNGSTEDTPLFGMFAGLSNVTCKGDETSIKNCSLGESSNNATCPSNSTVTVKCAGILPVCPLKTHFHCPADGRGSMTCISRDQLCDFTSDCWDGSDEINCENYTRCDFNDTRICGWLQAKNDQMDWTRHKGSTASIFTGPSADHNGNRNGYYLYLEVSNRQGGEKARILVIPRFQGDNNGLCKLRFYYHLYGVGIGTLRVLAADRYSQQTLWTKSYSQLNEWGRAEVPLFNLSSSFYVTFEGEHSGHSPHGDIAIDDISFTPECRPAPHENVTCKEGTFPCGSGECISLSKQCDFTDDCYDASDELSCGLTPGRCDFEADMCHWQNLTDDDFDWERHTGSTASFDTGPYYDHTKGYRGAGYYLYIEASNPRVRGDKARIISPQFMWQNVAGCTLRFYYHMKGLWGFRTLGTLRVILRNTITGAETSPLWHKSGSQGNQWLRADVAITTNWTVSQVIIEAERGSTFHGDIAVDDISFSSQCYPSEAVHIYKNYDVRLTDGKKGSFEGRVEIYRVGTWGTICEDGWGQKDAGVVCKQLGYGGVKSVHAGSYFGEGRGPIWLDDLACYGNETSLGHCSHNGWGSHDCSHSQDAGVVCDIDGGSTTKALRLKTNNSTNSGLVEIYHGGSWEPICYDGWDIHDAFVACRQLGFPGAKSITRETAVGVTRSLKKVQCQGGEDTLGECVHNGWSQGNCNYGFAGVICSVEGTAEGNIRLRGGSSEREGRVEVFHRGEWGTVCDDAWTEANARVVCYELGFTSVRKVHQSFGPGSGRVWLDRVSCHGNETALVKCGNSGWGATSCTHSEDIGVICSDDAYIGCYKDTQNHVMTHELTSSDMTPVKCIRRCQSKGFMYAGLEWANECYCGNHFNRYGNSTSCQLPCLGDASKVCGGTWALSVYNTDPAIVPTQVPGYNPVTQSCTTRIFDPWRIQIPNQFYAGDHSKGWISSPAFPNNYLHDTVCIWVLNLYSGTRAKVTFKYFQTERYYDYVEIRDGDKDYSEPFLTPVGGFTGNVTNSVTASGNVMWIKFYTDSSVNYKGFNLTYEAVGAPTAAPTTSSVSTTIPPSQLPLYQMVEGGCNGISHSVNTTFGYLDKYHSSGFIHSPNYPSNYDNNLLCRWFIRVAPGYRIHLSVLKEDVNHEAHAGGLGDKLTIEDQESSENSRDSPAPWSFLSKGSFVRLVFVTDSANTGKGFYLRYTRVPLTGTEPPTPRQVNTAEERKDTIKDAMSGGTIAGIVIPILLMIIVVLVILLFLKNRKKRLNQGVRHGFVNETYGDCESINMTATQGNGEAAQPVTAGQDQPPAFAAPAQEPTAYFTAAPPPYSQAAPGNVYFVPFAATPGGGMAPVGVDNPGYAQLYSAPPAYEAVRQAANSTTATGIGSVTSLREAAKDDRAPVSNGIAAPGAVYAPLSRAVLPPIRGNESTGDPVKKQAPQEEEAGPLPEKSLLTVEHFPEPSAPPRPLSATSQVRVVSPAPPPVSAMEFDTEVPFDFLCPITNKIMSDPVKASDGYNYERKAIRRWFRKKRSSPMTNETLTDFEVRPNDELRSQIERFVGNHSVV